LTCGGGLGVKDVYKHISSELRSAMLLSGVAKVTALNREYLALTLMGVWAHVLADD